MGFHQIFLQISFGIPALSPPICVPCSTKEVCVTAEMCPQKPEVTVFYEPDTHTVCSVVRDPNSYKVAVVDSATRAIEMKMGLPAARGGPG